MKDDTKDESKETSEVGNGGKPMEEKTTDGGTAKRTSVTNRLESETESESSFVSELKGRSPAFLGVIMLGGILFGFGLGFSEMAQPEVVLDFLQVEDLGLLFVMGMGVVVAGSAFALAPKLLDKAPLTGNKFEKRDKSFDTDVIVGAVIFGAGWGISGICPGSAYASVGIGNYPILIGIGTMFVGAYLQGVWRRMRAK